MADRALAMARRVGDRDALTEVLGAHSWTDMDPERSRERLAIADELVRVAPGAMPFAECEGHVFRFVALVESGDLQGADAALAAARSTTRLPISHWMVLQWETARAMLAGQLADAEALSIRGAEAAREAGAPPSCRRIPVRRAAVVYPRSAGPTRRAGAARGHGAGAPRPPGLVVRQRGPTGMRAGDLAPPGAPLPRQSPAASWKRRVSSAGRRR